VKRYEYRVTVTDRLGGVCVSAWTETGPPMVSGPDVDPNTAVAARISETIMAATRSVSMLLESGVMRVYNAAAIIHTDIEVRQKAWHPK
jgi:hypothetical protein